MDGGPLQRYRLEEIKDEQRIRENISTGAGRNAGATSSNVGVLHKEALEDVKEHQDHIADLIAGRAEPERCGHCEYCRATKQITAFTSAADIEVE